MYYLRLLCIVCLALKASYIHPEGTYTKKQFVHICQQAATNDVAFSQFKRNPYYRYFLENVSYEEGLKALEAIRKEYPELLDFSEQFRLNDSLGNPIVYNYDNLGKFSPTTLRYIKIAGDLKREFGDKLNHMHILEIGGGYGGLCKILADICHFASYTILDLPQCNALSRKYLGLMGIKNVHFIDQTAFDQIQKYDLVISNLAFSKMERTEQTIYLEKTIKSSPNGYLTMDLAGDAGDQLSMEELIYELCMADKQGRVLSEKPLMLAENKRLLWKNDNDRRSTKLQKKKYLYPTSVPQNQNAITYSLHSGLFEDILMAYAHAKWIARQYGLPFLYRPFLFSDELRLSELDQHLEGPFHFKKTLTISHISQLLEAPPSTLLVIPTASEINSNKLQKDLNKLKIPIDWDDGEFRRELVECLKQKKTGGTTQPTPSTHTAIHVAVDVRRSSKIYTTTSKFRELDYLLYPPQSYYISEILRVAQIFPDKPLVVYIFTDNPNAQQIAINFAIALQNPNIIFSHTLSHQHTLQALLEDIDAMPTFDCLIKCQSNFSIMAELLCDPQIVVTPLHVNFDGKEPIVDQVEIKFKSL